MFTYMVALNTNLINFDSKHSGKIVGFLNAFFAGSPSIYSVIYYNGFTHGDITDTSNQDFPGFMIMLAISFAVADILCIIFLRIYDNGEITYVNLNDDVSHYIPNIKNADESSIADDEETRHLIQKNAGRSSSNRDDLQANVSDNRKMTIKEILKDYNYHLLVYSFAFASVIGLVFANNTTLISKSVHLNSHDNVLTIIIPVTNAILSAGVGLFSDFFKAKISRMWIVVFGCLAFTGAQVLLYLQADSFIALVFVTVLVGAGIAIIWSICPTIMKEMYNVGNFGRNWGMCILVAALLGAGLQAVFGALYDSKASGDHQCYGMSCIRGGAAMLIASGGLSVVFGLILQFIRRVRR